MLAEYTFLASGAAVLVAVFIFAQLGTRRGGDTMFGLSRRFAIAVRWCMVFVASCAALVFVLLRIETSAAPLGLAFLLAWTVFIFSPFLVIALLVIEVVVVSELLYLGRRGQLLPHVVSLAVCGACLAVLFGGAV